MADTLAFDLHWQRGSFRLHASAELPVDQVVGIVGASGAGKSSLLRCLAGLETDCSGHINMAGTNWLDTASAMRLAPEKRDVGMVFQQYSLFSHLTVAANLHYAWQRTPQARRRFSATEAAKQLEIGHLLERMPATLSGGEAQRIAIARALVANPALLLLDEPLAAVDIQGRQEVMASLERLRAVRPVPMLYVSHNLDEVARLADSLLLMQDGKVVAQGAVTEMLTRLDLPIAQAPDAEALLEAAVLAHHDDDQLSSVGWAGAEILIARQNRVIGEALRLRIQARDVSLALSRPVDSSILNILPCTVSEIAEIAPGQCMLRLDCAGQLLLARITQRSLRQLSLELGKAVFAQIKSVALA